jgi:hypothetical protein
MPATLAGAGEGDLYTMMLDYVSFMEKEQHAGSYTESTLKVVRSWLLHNGKEIKRKIKIKGARDTPTLRDERVPTQDELKRIFLSGDKKARAACAIIAHAGCRIETLGNYQGIDGLRIKDLPDIEISGDHVGFKQKPALLIVRKELSKAGHQYFTFLSEEGCEHVKDYLTERIRESEALTRESALITPKLKMKPFIRTGNVGDAIRGAIRAGGFPWRPYVLRAYFDTQLMLAESKGLVMRDYRQFWMGHKGDIENRYTTNKQRLPESVIEDMREAYRKGQEFLQTTEPRETDEERLAQAFRKQILLVSGFKQDEVDRMDLSTIDDEKLQEMVKKKLLGTAREDSVRQKVVDIDEAESYLSKGWQYVASLPGKKVVIKSNSNRS